MSTTSLTPVARFLRRTWQKAFGTFYEGPEPPQRLREAALAFFEIHPDPTRTEVLEFACQAAEEAYRAGYVRGLEWTERDLERRVDPRDEPEQVEEELVHGWEWMPTQLEQALEDSDRDRAPARSGIPNAYDHEPAFARHKDDHERIERDQLGRRPRR